MRSLNGFLLSVPAGFDGLERTPIRQGRTDLERLPWSGSARREPPGGLPVQAIPIIQTDGWSRQIAEPEPSVFVETAPPPRRGVGVAPSRQTGRWA